LQIKVASLMAIFKATRRVFIIIKGIFVAIFRVGASVRVAMVIAVAVAVAIVVNIEF
jgi:hypothetical protein